VAHLGFLGDQLFDLRQLRLELGEALDRAKLRIRFRKREQSAQR